jgi:diphthamide synthase (EF-2-diphthine--ammonia ligase)
MSGTGMEPFLPLWKKPSLELAREFLQFGFKAVITCIDSHVLPESFVGKLFNKKLLSELPLTVDPCGENGEFHSFVYDGPNFLEKILYRKGKTVFRDNRFYFCDLVPVNKKCCIGNLS